ncbi:MAG: hypothetical protein ABIR48_03025 [Gammaproteobacteria bacterium]
MRLKINRHLKTWLIVMLGLNLAACIGEDAQLPAQYWQGIEFGVETRPSPARLGINEVLVVATLPHRQPEFNLLVSISMHKDGPWVQSIQDGHTGIFRRGLAMRELGPQTLWVKIQRVGDGARAGQQTLLGFPFVVMAEK